MYTLKGIFPEPKKQQKKNFIQENMKQLKLIQGKSPKETQQGIKGVPLRIPKQPNAAFSLGKVKSSPSNKSGKISLTVGKNVSNNPRKKNPEIRIKKGDMAEFLQRKEMRHAKTVKDEETEEELQSSNSSNCMKDIGCQTIETNLANKLAECTKLTVLYPKRDDEEAKLKASGDSGLHRKTLTSPKQRHRTGEEPNIDSARNHSRLNAILERKEHKQDNKDPYLPSGYQKGVVPAYLRSRKDGAGVGVGAGSVGVGGVGVGGVGVGGVGADDDACPPGHVALPDAERKETLRMLRNSFAELVSELNKMPVKTDTLRMRNRKMELEKQLTKLEEGIKVFSRPKVFVKIGE